MANMMKLVLPLLVVLLISTEAKFPNLGQLFGKRPSKGFDIPSIAGKILSKLPFKIPFSFRKPEVESPTPSVAPSSERSAPFCSKYDCPSFYEMKVNTSDYKLRCYPKPYTWVSTSVVGKTSREAGRTAFWRLFKYIQGSNEEEMKIKMTVPVTNHMQLDPKSDSFCKKNFTMSFFIPFKHQKDAPAPTADDVFLTVVKPFCAYVKVYGGYSNIRKVKQNYNALVKALNRDGLGDDFPTDTLCTAGYDEPMKIFNRHNEIWLVSKKHSPAFNDQNASRGKDLEVDTL